MVSCIDVTFTAMCDFSFQMDGDIRSSSSEELSDSSGSFAVKDSKDSKELINSKDSKDGKDL